MTTPATGANTALYYIEETVPGITPDTPEWKPLRFTGGIPAVTRDALTSAELDGSRDTKDVRLGNKSVGGDISAELSYGSHDDLLEAAMQGTWTTDVLKVGSTTKSFSLLVEYGDMPSGPKYDVITGVEVGGFSIDTSVNAIVTITFNTLGLDYSADATLPAGSTFAAATTTSPFTGTDGQLQIDGSLLGYVNSVSPTNANSQEANFALGSNAVSYISYGRAANTFSMEAGFASYDMYSKFIDETEFSATLTLAFGGNTLTFLWPRCRIVSGAPDVAGEGTIIQSMEVQALRDDTENTSLKITRSAA